MSDFDHQRGFTAFAASIRTRLHREAYRLCGDWHEAEDLVQLTLYKVYRRWEHLTRRHELSAYTRQALLHTYHSERRRPRWKYEISQAEPPELRSADQAIDDQITMINAIRRLAPRQRAVVILRFWQDLSVEQTAATLGCSTGTVTSQTHRALNTLRHTLTRPATRSPPANPPASTARTGHHSDRMPRQLRETLTPPEQAWLDQRVHLLANDGALRTTVGDVIEVRGAVVGDAWELVRLRGVMLGAPWTGKSLHLGGGRKPQPRRCGDG